MPMRTLSAVVVLLCACGGEYDVRLQVVPPALLEQASHVELGVVPSCEGELDEGPVLGNPLVRFAPGDSPPALGDSETGSRGLYARLVNASCEVIASGCSPVNLSAGGSDILRVIVRDASGNACAAGESCRAGACIAGGGIDASTTDALVDAGPPDVDPDPPDALFQPDVFDVGPTPVDKSCWVNEDGCDWSASFDLTPTAASDLPAGAANAAFTPNGCGLIFASTGGIHIATRTTPGGVFGLPRELAELETGGGSDKAIFAPGELEAFTTQRVEGDSFVFRATRSSIAVPFGESEAVSALNRVGFHSFDISLSGDGLGIYMARPRVGGASQDILFAARPRLEEEFGEPVVVAEVSTPDLGEAEPVVSADGRVMVFARAVDPNLRLFYSTRSALGEPWSMPTTLPGDFLSAANEREGALSPDACELLVNRAGMSTRLVYTELP